MKLNALNVLTFPPSLNMQGFQSENLDAKPYPFTINILFPFCQRWFAAVCSVDIDVLI